MKIHRRFRILFTITVLFTALIVVFGLVFRQFIYWQTSKMLHEGSSRYFAQIGKELSLEYLGVYKAVSQAARIVGNSGIAESKDLPDRLRHVPAILAAIKGEPLLSGLQVGYSDGDYFIVRSMNNNFLRSHFQAPENAAFVVDNLVRNGNGPGIMERIWLNSDYAEIARNPPVKNDYDPRGRPWYLLAIANPGKAIATPPYLFHFQRQMGVTIGYKVPGLDVVVAGDIPLDYLSDTVAKYRESPNAELIMVEQTKDDFLITAYRDPGKLITGTDNNLHRTSITELGNEVLSLAAKQKQFLSSFYTFDHNGRQWFGSALNLHIANSDKLFLVQLAPQDELLVDAHRMQANALKYTLVMILVSIPLTMYLARKIATPLQTLAQETTRISHFQFRPEQIQGSFIKEVDELANAMTMMEMTIDRFLSLINSLAREQDFAKLLNLITAETMSVGQADGAFSYIVEESTETLRPGALLTSTGEAPSQETLPVISLTEKSGVIALMGKGERTVTALADLSDLQPLAAEMGLEAASAVFFPLHNRHKETIGLLCLIYRDNEAVLSATRDGRLAFTEALTGFAAVTLESRKMLRMQKRLLDSFIKLLAEAIDFKSPYTGGHCLRVPIITQLLTEKACETKDGPLAGFTLSDEEWEALHIASWLHDCGKVTTPEFVVDKATKLECIYDRIHEIRMRFELLKSEAEIEFWAGLTAGGNRQQLQKELSEKWQQLDDEFAFVAECNLGGEFMADEKIASLQKIAARTWTRTIDDRIGISWEEQQRKERTPAPQLPVREQLLADKEEHLFTRHEKQRIEADNPYGFILNSPEYLFNRGELYNLSVTRGTLTNEDRYIINDHIVQTIIMLKQLPYPRHLRDVPDIAGGHHEKIDGTGYPRKLTGDQMSVQAKIMVIADIYEALTAADRPYKKAKTLDQVLAIMHSMKNNGHIDPDLYNLFLTSGAYLEYAKKYLQPEQIVEVDIAQYL